jgi:glutaconate CoA-transferase subunit B
VEVAAVREATGWDLGVADDVVTTPAPTDEELAVLRGLTGAA